MCPNLETCQRVNLTLAYAILKEKTPYVSWGPLSPVSQMAVYASELVTANCVKKKNRDNSLLEGIANVGGKNP